MGLLMNLFGTKGTVRFKGTTLDGNSFTGKAPIEFFGLSKEEIEEKLINALYVHEGIQAKELKIIAFCE